MERRPAVGVKLNKNNKSKSKICSEFINVYYEYIYIFC